MSPGLPLRGRVVDEAGKPIEGAVLYPDSSGMSVFEEMFSKKLETDSKGEFEWIHSPSETLKYSVSAEGYQGIRPLKLAPGEKEHIITLRPPIHVSGKVLDASTLEPIKEFTLIPGTQWTENSKTVSWQQTSGWVKQLSGGYYETDLTFGVPGMALRVLADGYAPSDTPVR